jgi:hypothetical protein
MTGTYFASGPCAFCQCLFTFNPERVPSIPANAWSAAEIIAAGGDAPPLGAASADLRRVHREGQSILPGAYDVSEGFPP